MKKYSLEVEIREKTGSASSNRLRKMGQVPGVIYGKKFGTSSILADKKSVIDLFRKMPHIENTVIDVSIKDDSRKLNVIIRDYQTDVCSDKLMHLDLYEVIMDEKVTLFIPVKVENVALGQKMGGILEVLLDEIEIECFPGDIPEDIIVDVSDLEIGDSIHVNDLKVSEKISILTESEKAVLLIAEPTKEEAEAEEGEEEIAEETKSVAKESTKETESK
jgi:large subunit ribosomal protein L25